MSRGLGKQGQQVHQGSGKADDEVGAVRVLAWRPTTRRSFLAMIVGAAAIAALPQEPRPASSLPKWIGHC